MKKTNIDIMMKKMYIGHFIIWEPNSGIQNVSDNFVREQYVKMEAHICANILQVKFLENLILIFLFKKYISIRELEIADNEVHKPNPKYFRNGTNVIKKIAFNITDNVPKITGDFVSPEAK